MEKADEAMLDNTTLDPDADKILSDIWSSGKKLGIVTTKYHHKITGILDKFEIGHMFDAKAAAEVDFIAVTTGINTKAEFEMQPNVLIIDSLKEILKIM